MIERTELREILFELFEAETGEKMESLDDDQSLAQQLGLDSVDMVSLIMQLERRFKIRMTHEELFAAQEVGQLLELVQCKVSELPQAAAA